MLLPVFCRTTAPFAKLSNKVESLYFRNYASRNILPWCRLFKEPNCEKMRFFNQYVSYNNEFYFFWKYIAWAFSWNFFHYFWIIFRNSMKLWSWGVFFGCAQFLKCHFSKKLFYMIFTSSLRCQQNYITEFTTLLNFF